MNNSINRQAAIDIASGYCGYCHPANIAKELAKLPSVHPEHAKGKWILDDEYIDYSACRHEKWSRVPFESLVKRFKFCPNCGADMRGEQDERQSK